MIIEVFFQGKGAVSLRVLRRENKRHGTDRA
jgi:hypothetical protein